MPNTKKITTGNKPTPSVAEIREWYNKNKSKIEKFERVQASLQLLDYTKSSTSRSFNTFSKETLRTYMRNPLSNYRNLRNLSRFLYYRSSAYRRLIWFNATMIDLNARSVIPLIDITQGGDSNAVLQSYYETLMVLEKMNLPLEFLKAYLTAWREDVFFGCAYYDEKDGYFILPLDPDYCKISGTYFTGDFSFVMDMTYFRNNQTLLEYWGDPFQSMYRAYESDTVNGRWQPMPDENCVCLKVNVDDYEIPLPPYLGLFNSIINLTDLEDIQAIADEQQIYKLITATIPTIDGSKDPDDFSVDPNTAIDYFNRMLESLPEYVDAVISPIPLSEISFPDDQATDTNKVEKATETLFNTSGGAQILNSSSISGTTAWNGAIKADQEYGISSLLPQTQAYLNRFVSYFTSNPAKIKLHEVTAYTKDSFKENVLKDAQYGLPTKLLINSLNGFSELETISMSFLEGALGIPEMFVPLSSSYTQSGSDKESGGQEKTDDDLTDEGEASRDKRDTAKG